MTHWFYRRSTLPLLAALAAAALAFAPPPAAAAAKKAENSLTLVPANAAFYSAMFHNRAQIEAVGKSKAWAKLTQLPLVQMGVAAAQVQLANPDPKMAALLKLYEQPENQQLVGVLGQLFADEVFVYGGDSLVGLVELLGRINSAVRVAPVAAFKGERRNPQEMQIVAVLRTLSSNLELVKTPELVFGFRLRDTDAASAQLKRLEALLDPLLEDNPYLKGRLKRVKVKGKDFLTLTLDGGMVPWKQVPIEDYEAKQGEYSGLVKKLKGLKLTVSLGVRGNYLLLSVGESLDLVEQLGARGAHLAARPELKPLAKFADQKLLSVGYVSKALRRGVAMSPEDLDGIADMVKGGLEQAPIGDDQRKRIGKDLADLVKEMKAGVPEVGAVVAFSFGTERGQEGYIYDYSPTGAARGTEPLTLLNHLGGDPILAAVARVPYQPDQYKAFVKWTKIFHGHIEEFALGQLDDTQKGAYEQFGKVFYPLLKRLDEITGTMLLPALADGQTAFVLDAKWKSKQWHPAMATPVALPLPEMGLVMGVSDAALLRKGMAEYRKLFNDTVAAVRGNIPFVQIPDLTIPEPEELRGKAGTLFYYPLPEALGVDKRVLPTAGLSQRVAVLTLSNDHAERLLESKPLQVDGGPLARPAKPLLTATYVDSAKLVDTLAPWIEFAVVRGMEAQGVAQIPGMDAKAVLPQIHTVLEVLKCLRGGTSATYVEDGVTVTHTETVIRDLK